MSIITISHEAFGDGRAVSERVATILDYRCISREVLIEASRRYGIAERKFFEILEEKPHHWWVSWLEVSEFIATFSKKQPYVSSRSRGTWFTTGAPVRSFFPGFATC